MTAPNPFQQTVMSLLKAFRTYVWLWVIPTVALTAVALVYAIAKSPTWQASQALVVRDEARGLGRQGRFESTESMRASHETIVEVAKSTAVISAALKQLGSPKSTVATEKFPADADILEMQESIAVGAPKGSELGTTEVLYLSVNGKTPEEAIARTSAICDQLENHLGKLRNTRASSVTTELEQSLQLALADLQRATDALSTMEREVGGDLAELRVLNQSGSGEGNLRSALNEVKSEIRHRQSEVESHQALKQVLVAAAQNPDELLAMPSSMFAAQPALKRLKDGLVDAQLRTSDLKGKMSSGHPLVQAAIQGEEAVRENLRSELAAAVSSCDSDLQVTLRQLKSLTNQQDDLQERLGRLAGLRAEYAVLVNDVEQRTSIVQQVKQDLANARATQSSSQAASLITRFQSPQVGDSPVGPGRITIVGIGLLGGFMTGAGLVFLIAPIGPNARQGRRLTDFLGLGRRATDRQPAAPRSATIIGRRAEDQATARRASDITTPGRRGEDQRAISVEPPRPRREDDDRAAS
ncbi:MAG TPA: Wzz/FepE/Etk N-terminal domain-containing protein [Pirellulaceae bacterium]|nr:Wzz/FepE/Etk N-terminal domain-containing protein [Pirellulaceae bacterium]